MDGSGAGSGEFGTNEEPEGQRESQKE